MNNPRLLAPEYSEAAFKICERTDGTVDDSRENAPNAIATPSQEANAADASGNVAMPWVEAWTLVGLSDSTNSSQRDQRAPLMVRFQAPHTPCIVRPCSFKRVHHVSCGVCVDNTIPNGPNLWHTNDVTTSFSNRCNFKFC